MKKFIWREINSFIEDTSGQGIVEYGAILAFVSLLIGMLFAFNNPWTPNHGLRYNLYLSFNSVRNRVWMLTGLSN